MTRTLTAHQAKFFAHELRRSYANDHVGKLAGLLFDAQVEPKPHQIDAALFALKTPFLPGVILADEVGLGKTIEAGIVIAQFWAERRRKTLIIAPSSLRQQWRQELHEKFFIPSELLDAKNHDALLASREARVLICSYEYAAQHRDRLMRGWDLIIADEAHRLRSFWNGKSKTADAISTIFAKATKSVLLTATPLQNRLEELYGLVSVFAPDYFHSLAAFKARYIGQRDLIGDDDLVQRVAVLSKRTLRRDVDKYVRFTERMPITIEFDPSQEEKDLYDLVNEYLQRDELFAFADSQRHLSSLIIRKRLGSSTYAVASTLEKIADRLESELNKGQRRSRRGALVVDEDFTSDELEEADRLASDTAAHPGEVLTQKMKNEVDDLRAFADLARSITINQKALRLEDALVQGFERLREVRAPEKAIIFTDSTTTQDYLAGVLKHTSWGDGLVLFNGANNSPEATAIYKAWLADNSDSDIVTGNPAADRRKALVDYFKNHGTIMIATEAAAEGINLQFCSMLVNYDLPWNPQRVEQRIGRVHRFGQRHNVVVVNFANKGNIAERRILELLSEKFHLFENVFGASDQVLGAIEDGLNFEKRITSILQRCKTADEISHAFDELEEEYADEISKEMAKTRAKVFDNLDPDVTDRLKNYDEQSGEVLNKFERLLLEVTKHELRDFANFEDDGRYFTLVSTPSAEIDLGSYYFKSHPRDNARQYRYSSPLASYVVDSAIAAETPTSELDFSISASNRVASVARQLEGQTGVLTARLVTFVMTANDEDVSESYILTSGRTDTGEWLDEEQVTAMLDLQCIRVGDTAEVDTTDFEERIVQRAAEIGKEVKERNTEYYEQQETLLERRVHDREAESNITIQKYRAKAKEHRKLSDQADDPMERLVQRREAIKWERRADDEDEAFRTERRKLRAEADEYLDLIAESLRGTTTEEPLFTIRWRIMS